MQILCSPALFVGTCKRAAGVVVRAASAAQPQDDEEQEMEQQPWKRRVAFISVAMMLCNLDRTALSVAGIPIMNEFGFSPAAMCVFFFPLIL